MQNFKFIFLERYSTEATNDFGSIKDKILRQIKDFVMSIKNDRHIGHATDVMAFITNYLSLDN